MYQTAPAAAAVIITDAATLRRLVTEAVTEAVAKIERGQSLPDRLLNSQQAADYLGLSSSNAVRIRVHRGELECVRIGRSLRFRQSDLDRSVSA